MSESESVGNGQSEPITVLLVDDHAIWRGGVRSMLEDTEFVVVGEASSGPEAIETARMAKPRLVLLDIRMAGGDGLGALVALKEQFPLMAVVMLTTYDNPTYMARAVAGGAAGYLLKGVDREEMLQALRAVAGGETLLAREDLVRSLRSVSEMAAGSKDLIEPLTDREQEVLLHGQFLEQAKILRHHADGIAGLTRIRARHNHRSGRGREQAGHQFQSGGFTRAVGAEQSADFARLNLEIQPVQGVKGAVSHR